MGRIHALEWEDLQWFPASWRDFGTDFLKFIATKFYIYKPILPLMQRCFEKSGQNHWVDLASGGGSGLICLTKDLKLNNPKLKITLTDFYPNIKSFESLKAEMPDTFSYEKLSIMLHWFLSIYKIQYRPYLEHFIIFDLKKRNKFYRMRSMQERQ
jgi:hypothetical protein